MPTAARQVPRERQDGRVVWRHRTNVRSENLATALGWLGVGLGLAEVVLPRALSRLIGVRDTAPRRQLVRLLGVREVATGIGILAARRPTRWLWSRVGGDALDLGLLLRAARQRGTRARRLASATLAVAGVTALDLLSSRQSNRLESPGIRVRKAVTIKVPREEVYRFWRRLENLPQVMTHLESVQDLGGGRSRWRAKGPAGTTVEWEAELVQDDPNNRLGWRSLEGAEVSSAGSVTFRDAPGGRGTEVMVDLHYDPPVGAVGNAVATLFRRDPASEIGDDLRGVKRMFETEPR